MPFSGGGSGPSTPLNHNHTNFSGEGGSLDSNTLLNGVPLVSTPFPATDHVHNAVALQGGALDNTTLLNAAALVNTSFDPNVHLTNTQTNEGGSLVANSSIVTGASITINGVEYPIEVLI